MRAPGTAGWACRRRPAREGWLIALGGLGLRLGVVAWAVRRIPPAADGAFYHRIAARIAAGLGYTWLWPDGTVTYAAHYPVGYPALLAPFYLVAGDRLAAAMAFNACLGALAVLATHRLLARYGRAATAGALLVALHPALVAYTPALMTEGVTAALLVCAAWAASKARSARRLAPVAFAGLGLVLGIAALVRPQSILLAPFFGAAARPSRSGGGGACRGRRLSAAALATAIALAACAPWTLRNCARMGRCSFVSANAGWNLLIGAQAAGHGGWAPLDVPAACRTVWGEADKDRCFARAALAAIGEHPSRWLALAPDKLRATFETCGAAGWYLHAANPRAFGQRAKIALDVTETIFSRLVLCAALLACLPPRRKRRAGAFKRRVRALVVAAGAALALSPFGWLAWIALFAALALSLPRRLDPLRVCALATLGSLILAHAVFFGGGRYQLAAWPLVCAVAGVRLGSGSGRVRGRGGN